VAASLGIARIIIHKYSSVLSAYGLALAEVVKESQEPVSTDYLSSKTSLQKQFEDISNAATEDMKSQGFAEDQVRHDLYLNMRYEGSDTSLMILKPEDESSDFLEQFRTRHRREFNFNSERPVLVDDIRVRTTAASKVRTEKSPLVQLREANIQDVTAAPDNNTNAYFNGRGRIDTPVYLLDKLDKNARVHGPAVIIDKTQTIVVVPGAVANILETCIVIDLKETDKGSVDAGSMNSQIDPIRLSIFGHRFMSIAEQMGRTLQKTSVSTNIKERLDFSCALFSPDGGLVANAPHVPVHLGSMQFAVRFQHQKWLGNLKDGDVLVANHPSSGGTHLPDITVSRPLSFSID
jgi:5-oxoprolinase (ATP-hydrolysing)